MRIRICRQAALLLGAASATSATALAAQTSPAGQVASSAAGRAGQRQTRDQGIVGLQPLGAIDGRIRNRVESRIRSRIDRYYDPQANALSPFVVAGERARARRR
jgi:hypothetical protein